MNKLNASGFKRIHLGLLLDLLLMFFVPAVMGALLMLIYLQVSAAGMDEATVEMLLRSPTLAVRGLYAFLALQYCLAALCTLLAVSGIGEMGTNSRQLCRAKHAFLALTITDAVAMITHISDVLLPGNGRVRLLSVAFITSILLLLLFRCFALRSLMLGCGEVLNSIGAQELCARSVALSYHITAAIVLLLICLLTTFMLALVGIQPAPQLLLVGAVLSLIYYIVVFILVIRCIRKVANVIATISE